MSTDPDTYGSMFSEDFVRAATRRRLRRGRRFALFVGLGTGLVLVGLLSIPLFLLGALLPGPALPPAFGAELARLLAGSLRAAVCAMLVALPLGFATAAFSAHFCAPRLRAWLKPALEMLEAVPTVVLGLVAAATFAPWLKLHVATLLAAIAVVPAVLLAAGFALGARVRDAGRLPLALLPLVAATLAIVLAIGAQRDAAAVVPASPWNAALVGVALGFAALPLVFSLAEDALLLVPGAHAQAAFALGATRWQALTSIVLPAAGSGIVAAALLGFSRCFGETMIVLMASGNTPIGGFDPLAGLRSLSAELALGMSEAAPASGAYRALLLAALVLLLATVVPNLLADRVRERLRRRLAADARAA
ncbi:MAG TPA: ABC transporter permease subunit [Dokdonella sp.]